jgi:uncharacterized repeat protein (TIGR01451 family)
VTYTVVVVNNGPHDAENVVLTDTMPAGTTFNFATIDKGSCAIGFPLLQCNLGTLAPAEDVTLTVRVTPGAGGTITNTASVTSDTDDPDTSDNSASATTTVDALDPELSLSKSAEPSIYSYPGQVVTYAYQATNTGNVALDGPISVTDDRLGTFQCGAMLSLAPGASTSCTRTYAIVAADLNAANSASITNSATATGAYDGSAVTSAPAQATIRQVPPTARVTPTNTTCPMIRDGTARDLAEVRYGVKSGRVLSVAPGVFFYYSMLTAPSGSFDVRVSQSNTSALGWGPIGIKDLGQVIVWTADCAKQASSATWDSATGDVAIHVDGAVGGAAYYVGVKYDPTRLVGRPADGRPTVTYRFVTSIDGTELIASWDSVDVKPR